MQPGEHRRARNMCGQPKLRGVKHIDQIQPLRVRGCRRLFAIARGEYLRSKTTRLTTIAALPAT